MTDGLRALGRTLARRSETPTAAEIDTQSVKTTKSSGPSGCDTGKKVKGRKRHLAVDVEGFPIEIRKASVQDRDGAPAAVLAMLEALPLVRKLRADGGYRGPELAAALKDLELGPVLEIVEKPKDAEGFVVVEIRVFRALRDRLRSRRERVVEGPFGLRSMHGPAWKGWGQPKPGPAAQPKTQEGTVCGLSKLSAPRKTRSGRGAQETDNPNAGKQRIKFL